MISMGEDRKLDGLGAVSKTAAAGFLASSISGVGHKARPTRAAVKMNARPKGKDDYDEFEVQHDDPSMSRSLDRSRSSKIVMQMRDDHFDDMFHLMKSSVPLNLLTPDVFEEIFDVLEKHRHDKREWTIFMNQVNNRGGAQSFQHGMNLMFPI